MAGQERAAEVFVGLGSNLGRPLDYLRAGVEGLMALPGLKLLGRSSCYLTAPVGRTDQPAFANAVVRGMYDGTPLELLTGLLAVEAAQGRQRRERWGPRTLDLDLIFFGGLILDLPQLKVPHPETYRRAFVLVPLMELAPELVLPLWGQTAGQLLDALGPEERARQKVERMAWA